MTEKEKLTRLIEEMMGGSMDPTEGSALADQLNDGLYAKAYPEKVKPVADAIASGALPEDVEGLKILYYCFRADAEGGFASYGGEPIDYAAFAGAVERRANETIESPPDEEALD